MAREFGTPHSTSVQVRGRIHLNKERAVVQLGNSEDISVKQNTDVWYLDTGASNHMTGNWAAFSDLDLTVNGTIKFGDGSVVDIVGRGTILFAARKGRHRALTNAYFIPRLRSNIISLGQLDESGCVILVKDSVLSVRDQRNELLAKVRRSVNCLYKITLTLAQPVSLLARTGDPTCAGMKDMGTLASRLYDGSARMAWCAACLSLVTPTTCATRAWPGSKGVHHSHRRRSSGQRGGSIWFMATFAAPSHRQHMAGVATSSSSSMMQAATCGSSSCRRRMKLLEPSSSSRPASRWRLAASSVHYGLIEVVSLHPSRLVSTVLNREFNASSPRHTPPKKMVLLNAAIRP